MVDVASENKSIAWQKLLAEHRSPQAIAAGISFGIVLGLIPKDSLIALFCLLAIAMLPIHQLVACAVAITVTLLSGWTNLVTHPVGEQFLRLPIVGHLIALGYKVPLIPWLRLENSLVAGALVMGAVLWLPSYLISKWFASKAASVALNEEIVAIASSNVRHQRGIQGGSPLQASPVSDSQGKAMTSFASSQKRQEQDPQTRIESKSDLPKVSPSKTEEVGSCEAVLTNIQTEISTLSNELNGVGSSHDDSPRKDSTRESSSVVRFDVADRTASSNASEPSSSQQDKGGSPAASISPTEKKSSTEQADGRTPDSIPWSEDRELRETVIEVVRFKRSSQDIGPSPEIDSVSSSQKEDETMNVVSAIQSAPNSAATREQEPQATSETATGPQGLGFKGNNAPHFYSHPGGREESLRHILKHIHGTRDARREPEKTA